jgi:LPS-assembly lipoprotein
MSWFKRFRALKTSLSLAAVAAPLALGGCFQPLYGSLANGQPVDEELKTIEVAPIPERIGHYLGNDLIFALNGTGAPVKPKYRLIVSVREQSQTPLLDTVTGRPTASTLVVNADYKLLKSGTLDIVTSGATTSAVSYDRTSQRFANFRAARDSEERNAQVLADNIRTRIALALAQGS